MSDVGVSPLTGIGQRIREAREARGYTHEELAGMLQWHPRAIANMETMPARWLSDIKFTTVAKLAQALHVQIGYLCGEHAFLPKVEHDQRRP